jgi:hypothetical protein
MNLIPSTELKGSLGNFDITIIVYNNIPTYYFNSINNRYNGDPIFTKEYQTICNSEIYYNLPDEDKKKLFS